VSAGYDAILAVSFGGPERPEDVLPFLENVTRGRNVPRDRLLAVAEHYHHVGGGSPINSQVRSLVAALALELKTRRIELPVFWGNRNWHPMLAETVGKMAEEGVQRALAVVLSAYSSYSSCRQYLDDIARARSAVGAGAPQIDKVRAFYNHPEFIAVNAQRVRELIQPFSPSRLGAIEVVFTAHSIPEAMARNCDYERQLQEASRLVAEQLGIDPGRWTLAYQSRSGRPEDPWLGPDILDKLEELKRRGVEEVVIHPIGFLSDHVEVLYDLDVEARRRCEELGLSMLRSRTTGTHPGFVGLLGELIAERIETAPAGARRAVGRFGLSPDQCALGCCPRS
jgi:protoporphyrin/coproporphyrin ferrochelatase